MRATRSRDSNSSSSVSRSSASTSPSPAMAPLTRPASPARASAQEPGSAAGAPAGPSTAVTLAQARTSCSRRPGPAGSGTSAQPTPSSRVVSVSAGRRRATRSRSASPQARVATLRGRLQSGRARGGAQLALLGRRLAHQQRDQLVPATLALALAARARLGVALHGVRGDLVDVGEDRLGQQAQRAPVEAGRHGGAREPAPRHARAHAVGRLERVERAALAQLAPAEPHVHLAAGAASALGVADQRDELAQRLGHAGAHAVAEAALERPCVLGHLVGDRGEDLVGDRARAPARPRRPRSGGAPATARRRADLSFR